MENIKRIRLDRFYGGKQNAVTFSYDDGRLQDKKLIDIFNNNGLKATFHLNSADMTKVYGFLENEKYIECGEIKKLYCGHEVSCHTVYHPFPCDVPDSALLREVLDNKAFLEKYTGKLVRGMSYPFGQCDDRIVSICKSAGIEYARTAASSGGFWLPGDFMKWAPSFHHSEADCSTVGLFLSEQKCPSPRLLYIWGHSYEFDEYGGWDEFKEICSYISGRDNIWYATNIEIFDYIKAARALRFGADLTMVYNPSAIDIWFTVDGDTVCVNSGETLDLR